jgi:hypothetical protein
MCVLSACAFDPPLGDGDFACGAGGRCPTGFACAADGFCHRPPLADFAPDPIDPIDLASVPAADLAEPPCGLIGEICCANDACGSSGCCASLCIATGTNAGGKQICLGGTVADCGDTGQPCCENNSCVAGGCCSGGVCAESGAACLGGGTCASGGCGGCGGAGKPCCKGDISGTYASDYCSQSDTACVAGTKICVSCGGAGQACCEGNRCQSGGCCDHALHGCVAEGALGGDGQACVGGHGGGGACGGVGQPACGNMVGCTGDFTRNVGGVCVPCGAAGQPCCTAATRAWCAPPFACNAMTNLCAECGGDGQPCCAAGKCPNSTLHECNAGLCR